MSSFLYNGRGQPNHDALRGLRPVDPDRLNDPAGYLATRELAAAVQVALTLGMPLLLTGEPGLGKSRLADSIAWEFGLGNPLVFHVKSDTLGRDLFYRFDTIGRFHAAQHQAAGDAADPRGFVTFNALGEALLMADDPTRYQDRLGPALEPLLARMEREKRKAGRSVVLIDEIDKAPRDVPNDILNEIDGAISFRLPEIASRPEVANHPEQDYFQLIGDNRPIVIITSNSEKGLPDPFLRRCVFHHLSFPPYRRSEAGADQVSVEDIVLTRLHGRFGAQPEVLVSEALDLFRHLRERTSGYRPSLAELLNAFDYLLPPEGGTPLGLCRRWQEDGEVLLSGLLSCLFKNQAGRDSAAPLIRDWLRDHCANG